MALRTDQRLYFVHVPKTAGTTLIPLLDAHFHEDEICPAQLWRELVRLPAGELARYRLFRGHFGGHGLDRFLPEPPARITFLREPLALSRSTYLHVLREPNSRIHELVVRREMTLEDFARHPKTRRKISDKLVRNLSFDLDHDPDAGPILLSDESLAAVDRWVRKSETQLSDDERLERALETLRGCLAFGLTERFDESMALLSFTLGWPAVGSVQKLRVATERPVQEELDAGLTRRILDLNPLDSQLYAEGVRIFEERLAAMVAALQALARPGERLPARPGDDPALLGRLLDRHHARRGGPAAPAPRRALRLDFAAPLPGRGWHRRERVAHEGTLFRWTGPGTESQLDLPRPGPGPCRLRLAVINALDDGVLASLRGWADGAPLELTVTERAGPVARLLEADVPAAVSGAGPTLRLVLRVARTVAPRELDPDNPDERRLGVAVHWVELRPVKSAVTATAAATAPATEADTASAAGHAPDAAAARRRAAAPETEAALETGSAHESAEHAAEAVRASEAAREVEAVLEAETARRDRESLQRLGRQAGLQRLKRRVSDLPLLGRPLRKLRELRRRS